MAKHPHKIMLQQRKTWKCMLPNCRYFVHIGLEYTIHGQTTICWGCSEEFIASEDTLTRAKASYEGTLQCEDCVARAAGSMSVGDMTDIIEARLALARAGVKSPKELSKAQLSTMKMMGIKIDALKDEDKPETIEADEVHALDCTLFTTGECNCK